MPLGARQATTLSAALERLMQPGQYSPASSTVKLVAQHASFEDLRAVYAARNWPWPCAPEADSWQASVREDLLTRRGNKMAMGEAGPAHQDADEVAPQQQQGVGHEHGGGEPGSGGSAPGSGGGAGGAEADAPGSPGGGNAPPPGGNTGQDASQDHSSNSGASWDDVISVESRAGRKRRRRRRRRARGGRARSGRRGRSRRRARCYSSSNSDSSSCDSSSADSSSSDGGGHWQWALHPEDEYFRMPGIREKRLQEFGVARVTKKQTERELLRKIALGSAAGVHDTKRAERVPVRPGAVAPGPAGRELAATVVGSSGRYRARSQEEAVKVLRAVQKKAEGTCIDPLFSVAATAYEQGLACRTEPKKAQSAVLHSRDVANTIANHRETLLRALEEETVLLEIFQEPPVSIALDTLQTARDRLQGNRYTELEPGVTQVALTLELLQARGQLVEISGSPVYADLSEYAIQQRLVLIESPDKAHVSGYTYRRGTNLLSVQARARFGAGVLADLMAHSLVMANRIGSRQARYAYLMDVGMIACCLGAAEYSLRVGMSRFKYERAVENIALELILRGAAIGGQIATTGHPYVALASSVSLGLSLPTGYHRSTTGPGPNAAQAIVAAAAKDVDESAEVIGEGRRLVSFTAAKAPRESRKPKGKAKPAQKKGSSKAKTPSQHWEERQRARREAASKDVCTSNYQHPSCMTSGTAGEGCGETPQPPPSITQGDVSRLAQSEACYLLRLYRRLGATRGTPYSLALGSVRDPEQAAEGLSLPEARALVSKPPEMVSAMPAYRRELSTPLVPLSLPAGRKSTLSTWTEGLTTLYSHHCASGPEVSVVNAWIRHGVPLWRWLPPKLTDEQAELLMQEREAPPEHAEELQDHIEAMLDNGVVEECESHQLHACLPIFLVGGSEEAWHPAAEALQELCGDQFAAWLSGVAGAAKRRLVYDARRLNELLPAWPYTMQRLAELTCQPSSKLYTFDLKSAFHLIAVDEASRAWLGFVHQGQHYRFTRIPFGVSLSPAICCLFTGMFTQVVRNTPGLGEAVMDSMIFIDDLLVISQSDLDAEQLLILKESFQRCGAISNKAKESATGSTALEYVGIHVAVPAEGDRLKLNVPAAKSKRALAQLHIWERACRKDMIYPVSAARTLIGQLTFLAPLFEAGRAYMAPLYGIVELGGPHQPHHLRRALGLRAALQWWSRTVAREGDQRLTSEWKPSVLILCDAGGERGVQMWHGGAIFDIATTQFLWGWAAHPIAQASSTQEAEALAMLHGIRHAIRLGHTRVVVACDNQAAVLAVARGYVGRWKSTVNAALRMLLSHGNLIQPLWVRRAHNTLADALANPQTGQQLLQDLHAQMVVTGSKK